MFMFKYATLLFILPLIISQLALSQDRMRDFKGFITGHVYDIEHADPLEYANIILYSQRDSLPIVDHIFHRHLLSTLQEACRDVLSTGSDRR